MVSLCRVAKDRFGYALANGIVGLYGGSERFWRIKVCDKVLLVLYNERCRDNAMRDREEEMGEC